MICDHCKDQVEIERDDVPHVLRTCEACGREMRVCEPGDHGIGVKIRKGDRFTIPAGWLKISANPLLGRGQFTKVGLEWFAKLIFLADHPRQADQFEELLTKNDSLCLEILKASDLLAGVDVENPENLQQIYEILKDNQSSAEWFALMFAVFNSAAEGAIAEGDTKRAAWAVAGAERFRSLLVFKQQLEEVVWMGHSAKRLVDILRVWDDNRENPDEEFWQIQFNQNSYVLSQVFSVPVIFLQDKAYVGGMSIDRKDARFVDYLYSGDVSNEAILIEIKTPMTKLLGSRYRNLYRPSAEVSGTLVQIADYKVSLMQNLAAITSTFERKLAALNPRCLIIAGDSERELDNVSKRNSFELFRTNLHNVELITYDELFKKIEVLASLFNLVREKPDKSTK